MAIRLGPRRDGIGPTLSRNLGTHHAQGTRANRRGHRHLDAHPLGLADRSGLIRFKQ
jgi:hypothetical protein